MESPTDTTDTLGQFFAIWGQRLSTTQVGPATGKLTSYVNGKPYTGDPRAIPLGSSEDFQLDVGTPSGIRLSTGHTPSSDALIAVRPYHQLGNGGKLYASVR